ncbi:MAG: hypothetical protein BMS9Abin37_2193 [Acidobacteriota bacterium]|nr:MAG: hypothetical protein BMS9Abin37_2193 [Acidobacteriota bacterium]
MRAAALVFVLLWSMSGAAQPLVVAPSRDDTDCVAELEEPLPAPSYFRIVNQYRTRESGKALTHLREVTEDLLERTLERLGNLRKHRRHITKFDAMDACIQAASMMHTELGMHVFDESQYGFAEFHFDIAYQLIALIRDGDRHDRFFRNWLLALGYYLQRAIFLLQDYEHASHAFMMAEEYYDEAVRRFGDDAEVLLSAGTLWETSGPLTMRTMEKKHLKTAEKLYARAVAADPALAEAQLRYGRILEKLEKYSEVEAPIANAIALDESTHITYIAHLIAGRVAERGGRVEEAIGHYETAVELIPRWQVAYVALSYALHVSGRRKESAKVLATSLRLRPETASDYDGWWIYELGRTGRLDRLWTSMREEIAF